MTKKIEQLYSFPFLLLCASHVLFAASFTMMIPELPSFLTSMGGADYKGLIIALFTLSAGLSRPISGKLADTIGRIPVMVFGTVVCVVCSLLYPVMTSISGFLFLRFLHGFSTGFKPTAATAFAADIIPVDRRGEAMGILGISMNVGSFMSPPFGSYLVLEYSMNTMFYVSSFLAVISILMLSGLKETLDNKQKFKASLLKISKHEILERSAIPPAIMVLFVYFTFGILLTIAPDQADYVGLKNKGLVFSSLTIFAILSRFFAGRVSDRFGRVIVIKFSIVLLIISLIYMGMADSPMHLLLGAGALGFSTGVAVPAVFAWVIDVSPSDRLGRSMATVYIALEMGIGSGALYSAWLYDNTPDNFAKVFYWAAVVVLFAGIYLQFIYKRESGSLQS